MSESEQRAINRIQYDRALAAFAYTSHMLRADHLRGAHRADLARREQCAANSARRIFLAYGEELARATLNADATGQHYSPTLHRFVSGPTPKEPEDLIQDSEDAFLVEAKAP